MEQEHALVRDMEERTRRAREVALQVEKDGRSKPSARFAFGQVCGLQLATDVLRKHFQDTNQG